MSDTRAPIDRDPPVVMTALARGIDEILNGVDGPGAPGPRFCFVLMVAEFGAIDGAGVHYICNGADARLQSLFRATLATARPAPTAASNDR
jgi:hypothetical protein